MKTDNSKSTFISALSRVKFLPVICCAFTTIVAVPVSFILYPSSGDEINPAGAIVYFVICIVAAFPLGILNAFVIAPIISRPLNVSSKMYIPILYNFVVLVVAYAVILSVGYITQLGFDTFNQIVCLPWYLLQFFTPPIVAGSIIYSIFKLVVLRRNITSGLIETS